MTGADRLRLRGQLKVDEGYRGTLYKDSLGYWTIGYGRLLDPLKGGSISADEAEYLLTNDLRRTEKACEDLPAYSGSLASTSSGPGEHVLQPRRDRLARVQAHVQGA